MKFGKKASEAPARGDGAFLWNFQDGETKVRFVEEPGEWIEFYEHYTTDNRGFPCLRDHRNICPGCTSDNERVSKASRKYATHTLRIKDNRVCAQRVPVGVYNKLESRQRRSDDNTIRDRDYVVVREGTGMSTEYDVDSGDRYPVDFATYAQQIKDLDIETIFEQAFVECWGKTPDEFVAAAEGKPEAKTATADEFPSEASSATDNGADEEIDEATVRGMSLPQLLAFAEKAKVDIGSAETKVEVIDVLLKELG